MSTENKRRLGKGLSDLIGESAVKASAGETPTLVPVSALSPNPHQPRKSVENIDELAESIKQKGIINPITVRKKSDNKFEIIAGERRWRAAKFAGISNVPVVVKTYNDLETLEVGLIENIQRENLNPIDEATAYKILFEEYRVQQKDIAKHVGKSPAAISNILRLLELPESVQREIAKGGISVGHAKAILSVSNPLIQSKVCKKIIDEGLSVREAELLGRELSRQPSESERKTKPRSKKFKQNSDKFLADVEMKLSESLDGKVRIAGSQKTGRIVIDYYSLEHLNDIVKRLSGK